MTRHCSARASPLKQSAVPYGCNHRQRWYSQGHRPDLRLVRTGMRRRKRRTQRFRWGRHCTVVSVISVICEESQQSDNYVPFDVQAAHIQLVMRKLPCIIRIALRNTCAASDWKSKLVCFNMLCSTQADLFHVLGLSRNRKTGYHCPRGSSKHSSYSDAPCPGRV